MGTVAWRTIGDAVGRGAQNVEAAVKIKTVGLPFSRRAYSASAAAGATLDLAALPAAVSKLLNRLHDRLAIFSIAPVRRGRPSL